MRLRQLWTAGSRWLQCTELQTNGSLLRSCIVQNHDALGPQVHTDQNVLSMSVLEYPIQSTSINGSRDTTLMKLFPFNFYFPYWKSLHQHSSMQPLLRSFPTRKNQLSTWIDFNFTWPDQVDDHQFKVCPAKLLRNTTFLRRLSVAARLPSKAPTTLKSFGVGLARLARCNSCKVLS
jgi:hypothetical protein